MLFRRITAALSYGIPAVLCLAAAFWAGSQHNPLAGLFGFVPFFMAAAFLMIYGLKKIRQPGEAEEEGRDDSRRA